MCKKCEYIEMNTTKISPNKDTEYYVIQKNSKVFIIPNEETNSLSINEKDGSINEEHHITNYVEKDVTFNKSWLNEIVKIKDKTYTVFHHKFLRNLITETSNVKELVTLES